MADKWVRVASLSDVPAEGIGRLPANVNYNQTLAPEILIESGRID